MHGFERKKSVKKDKLALNAAQRLETRRLALPDICVGGWWELLLPVRHSPHIRFTFSPLAASRSENDSIESHK